MRRGLLVVAGVVLALLILAQVLLPGYAARRLTSDLQDGGTGVHVDVSAFPAVKLLVHHADKVTVTIARLRAGRAGSGTSVADLLARTKSSHDLDVHVGVVEDRLVRMHDVRLRKRGDQLTASVRLRRADVDDALPQALRVSGRSAGGDRLTVAGRTSVFGQRVAARASIATERGRIVLRPEGIPLASLVAVPIFSDPRVAIDGLGARPTPRGFALTARGHLTG
jgi:hypothetical protein